MGVVLVNFSHIEHFDPKVLLLSGFPVLIAAFCYPFGNQLVWEAKNAKHKNIPSITSPLLNNVFNKVLLLTLGSFPLWIALVLITQPPAPSLSQVINTSLVALLSGVFATSIFLFARNLASNSNELAGVDATQATEVIFALLGSIIFLGGKAPNLASIIGLVLILVGLMFFVTYQKV